MKMPVVIRLLGAWRALGGTPFEGQYLQAYDPTYTPPSGVYDGGILKVTRDPRKAQHFLSIKEATEKWLQSYGLRPDGKPNRPLTAFDVQIPSLEDAVANYSPSRKSQA